MMYAVSNMHNTQSSINFALAKTITDLPIFFKYLSFELKIDYININH